MLSYAVDRLGAYTESRWTRKANHDIHGCFAQQLSLLTTSSSKRRRLDRSDRDSPSEESSSVASSTTADQPSLSQAGPAESSRLVRSSQSPPPRLLSLPAHLHSDITDGVTGSSPLGQRSERIIPASNSSPLASYASLSLEGRSGPNMQGLSDNITEGQDSALQMGRRNSKSKQHSKSASIASASSVTRRCASPAKRPAPTADSDSVDAESLNTEDTVPEGVALDRTQSGGRLQDRSRRSVSVDMLGDNNDMARHGIPSSASSSQATDSTTDTDKTLEAGSTVESGQATSGSLPDIDKQIVEVMVLLGKPTKHGDRGFLVSARWLSRVTNRSSTYKLGAGEEDTIIGDVGPVDNTDLVDEAWLKGVFAPPVARFFPVQNETFAVDGGIKDERGAAFVPIREQLQLSEDYEILPESAWKLILEWYGIREGSPVIIRYAHDSNPGGAPNVSFELSPLLINLVKLQNDAGGTTHQTLRASERSSVTVVASKSEKFQTFLKRIKPLVDVEPTTKVRLWQIIPQSIAVDESIVFTPANSRSTSPSQETSPPRFSKLLLDLNTFWGLSDSERQSIDMDDQTGNPKYNGGSTIALAGINQKATLVVEEQIGGPAGGEWVSDSVSNSAGKKGVSLSQGRNLVAVAKSLSASAKSAGGTDSGRVSPGPKSTYMTRGRERRDGRAVGVSGLSNLGNTCYMNSALQCVRNVEELSNYFIDNKYKADLNPSNPLAHGGKVASAYGQLVSQMFSPTGPTTIQPRDFKRVIGYYGPSFSGYGQQDSQEFLGFLLDGLHEDLNRIQNKPYVENPDSTDDMVHDKAKIAAFADKCWEGYKARNDSVVVDLFAGSYKSTLICPVCDKISITFDPFTTLTLQLPIENIWSKDVTFYPYYGRPYKISVDMDKNGSLRGLKETLSAKTGVPIQRLAGAEVYKNKYFKMYEDYNSVADAIGNNDEPVFYELDQVPTNYPQKKGASRSMLSFSHDRDELVPAWDSPEADTIMVPIFHRVDKESRFARFEIFGMPIYMTFTREEAMDSETIIRKILLRAGTMTTRDIFADITHSTAGSTTSSSESPDDGDVVITTDEDASSSTDSKIKINSVKGEEDLVDVSMKDAPVDNDQVSSSKQPSYSPTLVKTILDHDTFIPNEVRTMFEIKIIPARGEAVATGWTSFTETTLCDTLESRAPAVSNSPESAKDEDLSMSDDEMAGSRSSFTLNGPVQNESISSDEDEDELAEMLLPPVVRPTTATSNNRAPKIKFTYSRKGKDKSGGTASKSSTGEAEKRPLIRPGEAIILDWRADVFEALFTARDQDEMRGLPTWLNMDVTTDRELVKKRESRSRKRNKGITLDDCLDEFAKEEVLSENDAWYCPRCKEHRRATKTFELWKSPDILVMHLKRFSSNRSFRDKIDAEVEFPTEGLDLSKRVGMHEDGKQYTYDLIAVDNHFGGLGGGHYTAYAQNWADAKWYNFDDSSVHSVQARGAVTSAAYLLFYRRRADHPLGGAAFESRVTEDDQSKSGDQSTSEDDKSFDASFRNGSSSGGAALKGGMSQAGPSNESTNDQPIDKSHEDEQNDLPEYSDIVPLGSDEDGVSLVQDLGEGILEPEDMFKYTPYEPTRGIFRSVNTLMKRNSQTGLDEIDDGDDAISDKALNGSENSDGNLSTRMLDFEDDADVSGDIYEQQQYSEDYSTLISGSDSGPPDFLRGAYEKSDYADEHVTEVRLGNEEVFGSI